MEVARTRSCIAVVDIGVVQRDGGSAYACPADGNRIGRHGQESCEIVGVMNKREIDGCPSEIDRREGRPAILCKIVQGRFSLAGECDLMIRI